MARNSVLQHGISIRLACEVYGISQTCYRYKANSSTWTTSAHASAGNCINLIDSDMSVQIDMSVVKITLVMANMDSARVDYFVEERREFWLKDFGA